MVTAKLPTIRDVPELEQLTAGLVAMAHAGTVPMCTDHDEWTSELEAERAAAAEVCTWCPMAAQCLSAGVATRSTWGIWGGIDLGDAVARGALIRRAYRARARAAA